ncbi:MAG TPA: TetR/AcrR family transcriptional regulator [Myxococcaceae bacterium]|jgi:AcrR family transcriptional regulator
MSPRVYSSARDRILDAAERLIRSRGAGQLSVEAVAQEAEVSKGGFFHHFASKDELLVAILDRLVGGVQEQVVAMAANDPEPRGAKLRAQIAMAFDMGEETLGDFVALLLAFLQVASAQPALIKRSQQINSEVIARDEAEDIPVGRAIAIQFALDGYGISLGVGSSALTPKQRAAFREALMELAQPQKSNDKKKRRTS